MHQDSVSTTKTYFKLSNQGDLNAIQSMFHPQATYSSVHTGLYYGVEDIMQMMRGFFAQFKTIQWQIESLKSLNKHITEVAFSCQSIDLNGHTVSQTGLERLVVVNGLIRHVEVR